MQCTGACSFNIMSLTSAVYPDPSLASGSPPLSKSDPTRFTLSSSAACQIPRSKSISVKDWAHDEGFDEQSHPCELLKCLQDPSIWIIFCSLDLHEPTVVALFNYRKLN